MDLELKIYSIKNKTRAPNGVFLDYCSFCKKDLMNNEEVVEVVWIGPFYFKEWFCDDACLNMWLLDNP